MKYKNGQTFYCYNKMSSILHFAIIFIFFEENTITCYGVRNKVKLQEVPNDIEMYIKRIKKMSGIFPNHEIEVQFDIEKPNYQPEVRNNYNRPTLRSNNNNTKTTKRESTMTESSTINYDTGKQVVYVADMKKALEEFEKKLNLTLNCSQQTTLSTVTPKQGSDNQLLDILKLLKKNGQLQKGLQKPNDEEITWLKIQVPTK